MLIFRRNMVICYLNVDVFKKDLTIGIDSLFFLILADLFNVVLT